METRVRFPLSVLKNKKNMVEKVNLLKKLNPNTVIIGTTLIVVPIDFRNINHRLIQKIDKRCPGLMKDCIAAIQSGDLQERRRWWIYGNNYRGDPKMLFIDTSQGTPTFLNVLSSSVRSHDLAVNIMLNPKSFDKRFMPISYNELRCNKDKAEWIKGRILASTIINNNRHVSFTINYI